MADNRAVAFLDILGFENKVETVPLDELSNKYENLVKQTRALLSPIFPNNSEPTLFPNRSSGEPWCSQYIFSDSIVLISNDDSEAACLELLIYTWRLSQCFLAAGMPLRGGIEYNEMYSNPVTSVFLGKALTEAFQLEGQQDWIGISISDTVFARYVSLAKAIANPKTALSNILLPYVVPLKNGTRRERRTINWRFNYVVENGTRSLFETDASPKVQRKIDNTLEYAKAVVRSGRIYSSGGDKDPIEIRAMFVGAKEPPFDHGDDL